MLFVTVPTRLPAVTDAAEYDPTRDQRHLLLEQVEGSLRVQSDEMDGLDRKVTTVLAATGVILGLVINNAEDFANSPPVVVVTFYAALVVLAAGVVAGVISLWPRRFGFVPEPRPFLDQHATRLPEFTLGELANTKADAFGDNTAVVKTKVNRLRAQMVLLAAGGALLVAAYVLERLVSWLMNPLP